MDEATLRRATEPFFTTKGIGKGTGLGLSMVHGLAAQSGGLMRINSRIGVGTMVELWLPVSGEAAMLPNPLGPDAAVAVAGAATLQPCRVLVVDDDPLIAAGTVAMLEDLGHVVIEAPSATRALEILRAGTQVDLVITDHAMPGMTGLELAREIQKTWAAVPVLLATGYADLSESEFPEFPGLPNPIDRRNWLPMSRSCSMDSAPRTLSPLRQHGVHRLKGVAASALDGGVAWPMRRRGA